MRTGNAPKIVTICILSFIALVLTAALVTFSVFGINTDWFSNMEKTLYEETLSADKVVSVDISWSNGRVSVEKGGSEISITEYSHWRKESRIETAEVIDGTLKIKQKSGFSGFSFFFINNSTSLIVTLPDKQYESFILSSTSGGADIKGISADTADIKSTSGSVKLDGITSEKLNIQQTSGSTKVYDSICDEATLKTTSGSVKLEDFECGSADIKCTSGSINATEFNVDELTVKMTSGSIKIDGNILNVTGETTSGSMKIASDTTPEIAKLSAKSGSVTLTIPDSEEGFKVKHRQTSGSFKSDFELEGYSKGNKSGTYTYGAGQGDYSFDLTSGSIQLRRR